MARQLNKEVTERDRTILRLKEDCASLEREYKSSLDRAKVNIEADAMARYAAQTSDIERQLQELQEHSMKRTAAVLDEREAALNQKERDIVASMDEMRMEVQREMAEKRKSLEQETMRTRQRLNDEFLEREKQREEEIMKVKLDLEQKHAIATQKLRDRMAELDREKTDFRSELVAQYEEAQSADTQRFEKRRREQERYELELNRRFVQMVEEHKRQTEDDLKDRALETKIAIQEQASHDMRLQDRFVFQQAEYAAEMDAFMKRMRENAAAAEEEQKTLIAEITVLKAQNVELVSANQRKQLEVEAGHHEEVSELRKKFTQELADRDKKIIALQGQLSAWDREYNVWLERAQGEIEQGVLSKYDSLNKELAQQLKKEAEKTRTLQTSIIREREEALAAQEHDMIERINSDRERMEREMEAKREQLTKEFLVQREELIGRNGENERKREDDVTQYKQELESKYQQKMRELREFEARIQHEKAAFASRLRGEYEMISQEEVERERARQLKTDAYEQQLHEKFKRMLEEFKNQTSAEAYERAQKARSELHQHAQEEMVSVLICHL